MENQYSVCLDSEKSIEETFDCFDAAFKAAKKEKVKFTIFQNGNEMGSWAPKDGWTEKANVQGLSD